MYIYEKFKICKNVENTHVTERYKKLQSKVRFIIFRGRKILVSKIQSICIEMRSLIISSLPMIKKYCIELSTLNTSLHRKDTTEIYEQDPA